MSGVEGHNGYYLRKTGDRVNELLSRQFVVPTLDAAPTVQTRTWVDGNYTVNFRVGELVRVPKNGEYVFYRLHDISDNGAIWVDATSADLDNYYTKNEIDKKLSEIVISGGVGGGVIILTEDEYLAKKGNNEIVDDILYFVMVDNEPHELYIGLYLIAKKGEIQSLGFPYTFPIIF